MARWRWQWLALTAFAPASLAAVAIAKTADAHGNLIAKVENGLLVGQSKDGSAITATLEARMAEARVPAVSIAYIDDGSVVWSRAYGMANGGVAARPDTPFQAASLSKAVAAAGALRLVERRKLSLDADVNARLKGWKVPGANPVSLRQLLSHTAGLTVSGYGGYPRGGPVPTVVQSLRGVAPSNTSAVRPFARPGEKFAYSGGGFSAAQLLMSDGAKTSFGELMERHVLHPAGMNASTFDQSPSGRFASTRAAGHDRAGKQIAGASHIYPELAAAGLWTTPTDYARFVIALQRSWRGERGALLSHASAQAMMSPVTPGYGLGIGTLERGGRPSIVHSGSNEGFRTFFLAFLDGRREGVVVMTNSDNGGQLIAEIARTVGAANGWVESPPPRSERAPD